MKNYQQKDIRLYRLVVGVLGLTVVTSIASAIVLALSGQFMPEVLVALDSASTRGLAGVLAPSPLRR